MWHQLAEKIDTSLFEHVVYNKYFSVAGVAQFKEDMAAVFCVFLPYTPSPEVYLHIVCCGGNLHYETHSTIQNLLKRIKDVLLLFSVSPNEVFKIDSDNVQQFSNELGIQKLDTSALLSLCRHSFSDVM